MILTGKAKKDFLSYYGTGEKYFETTISEIEQYDNIIDWLDSVGIYVEVWYSYLLGNKFWCLVSSNKNYSNTPYTDTRKESTKQAILKSNEIYNEEHSNIN